MGKLFIKEICKSLVLNCDIKGNAYIVINEEGFDVIGTALSYKEARKFIKENK